tara:strand:- start:6061 stop:7521 length:1461 start_codon:yes stop_codon:yes gene_type:complete
MKNFVANILEQSRHESNLDSVALRDLKTSITHNELHDLVILTSSLLLENGLGKNNTVIVACGNNIQQIIIHYAVILAGGTSVPLSNNISNDRLEYFIKELNPKVIFSERNYDVSGSTKLFSLTSLSHLIDLLNVKNVNECGCSIESYDVDPKQLVSIMYTSGSTGTPKGVLLNHGSVNQALNNIINYIGYSNKSKEIIPLPLNHNFGLGHIYCTHLNGGSAYILDGLRSIKSFYSCFDLNYDALALSPSMLKILLSDKYLNKTISTFSKLKYMVVNSEKLPADMIELLLNSCPNLRLMYYYGLTEASRSFFITFNKKNKQYFHSVGKPTSSNVKVRIVDGEIHIGGDHLFSGYWNEDSSQIQDGFFPTGDLGYLDEEGYLFITGRKKDQINVGGLKVSAEEVKCALLRIDGIDDAVVVALDDDITGEAPGALVVGDPGIDYKTVTLELRKQLEIYAIPKKIVFSDTIPRSDTGKMLISEVIKLIDK